MSPATGGKVPDDVSKVEWIEVEDKVAKERIGHSFRNIRQTHRALGQNSVSSQSQGAASDEDTT